MHGCIVELNIKSGSSLKCSSREPVIVDLLRLYSHRFPDDMDLLTTDVIRRLIPEKDVSTIHQHIENFRRTNESDIGK